MDSASPSSSYSLSNGDRKCNLRTGVATRIQVFDPLPSGIYDADEYFTLFKVRISAYEGICDEAFEQVRADWIKHTGKEQRAYHARISMPGT